LFPSGDIRDQIAKSEILMFLGRQIFWGSDPQISDRFYKLQSPPNMWQNLVTIGPESSEISGQKNKEDRNISSKI